MFPNRGGENDSRNGNKSDNHRFFIGESSNPASPPQPPHNFIDLIARRNQPLPAVPYVPMFVPFRGQPHMPPLRGPRGPLFGSLETPRVQHCHTTWAHTRPFSYQYLMHAHDPEGYLRSFDHSDSRSTSQPDDQLLAQHGEHLRNDLCGMVKQIAEKTEIKLKDLDFQLQIKSSQKGFLERKADIYRTRVEVLQSEVKSLQQTARFLKKSIKWTNEQRENAPEDEESYYVNPAKIAPVKLECVTCKRQVATVMMRQCRHLCVCKACINIIVACPVCGSSKVDCIEVVLPY